MRDSIWLKLINATVCRTQNDVRKCLTRACVFLPGFMWKPSQMMHIERIEVFFHDRIHNTPKKYYRLLATVHVKFSQYHGNHTHMFISFESAAFNMKSLRKHDHLILRCDFRLTLFWWQIFSSSTPTFFT